MYKKNSVTKFVTKFFGFLNSAIGFGKLLCFLKIKKQRHSPSFSKPGLTRNPCLIEVTRFELATPWSQTRCSTKLSHTSGFLPLRKGTSLYYPKSEYFVNRIFRILIIKILKLFRKMEVEEKLLPPVLSSHLFLRNSLSNSFY